HRGERHALRVEAVLDSVPVGGVLAGEPLLLGEGGPGAAEPLDGHVGGACALTPRGVVLVGAAGAAPHQASPTGVSSTGTTSTPLPENRIARSSGSRFRTAATTVSQYCACPSVATPRRTRRAPTEA